jgi:hypothetical protein
LALNETPSTTALGRCVNDILFRRIQGAGIDDGTEPPFRVAVTMSLESSLNDIVVN